MRCRCPRLVPRSVAPFQHLEDGQQRRLFYPQQTVMWVPAFERCQALPVCAFLGTAVLPVAPVRMNGIPDRKCAVNVCPSEHPSSRQLPVAPNPEKNGDPSPADTDEDGADQLRLRQSALPLSDGIVQERIPASDGISEYLNGMWKAQAIPAHRTLPVGAALIPVPARIAVMVRMADRPD